MYFKVLLVGIFCVSSCYAGTHKLTQLMGFDEDFFEEKSPFDNYDAKKLMKSAGPDGLLTTVRTLLKNEDAIENAFRAFEQKFGKLYAEDEREARKAIFKRNIMELSRENIDNLKGIVSSIAGVNSMSDLTTDEIIKTRCGTILEKKKKKSHLFTGLARNRTRVLSAPQSFDWRQKGAVTPVRDQGSCGSCWAFGTLASLETVYGAKGQKLDLSEQELVDCANGKYKSNGCNGGYPPYAMDYIRDKKGLSVESDYQYTERDGSCKRVSKRTAPISGHQDLDPDDDEEIMEAIATKGPVVVGQKVCTKWMNYKGDIFSGPDSGRCGGHAVAFVGYGTENGKNYWIVKNSWGTSWGEKGYMRQERGKFEIWMASVPNV